MIQIRIVFLLLYLFPLILIAQSPYHIDWKKESILIGSGILTYSGSYYLESKINPLTIEEIYALDRADINSFDRKASFFFSNKARRTSDVFRTSSYLVSSLVLINKKPRKDFTKILILYGETVLLTKGVTRLSKRSAKRLRPFIYNDLVSLSEKQKLKAQFSFFSGHVSATSSNCFFTAKVFSDYFPDSKYKPLVWTGAALIPAATGYLRVKAGRHFYSDVITGYFVGASIGILVPHLHKNEKDKKLSFYPIPNGIYVSWLFAR